MDFTTIIILFLIWLLICYLLTGFMFTLFSLFTLKKDVPFYYHFTLIIFWSYSLYHWWRDRR